MRNPEEPAQCLVVSAGQIGALLSAIHEMANQASRVSFHAAMELVRPGQTANPLSGAPETAGRIGHGNLVMVGSTEPLTDRRKREVDRDRRQDYASSILQGELDPIGLAVGQILHAAKGTASTACQAATVIVLKVRPLQEGPADFRNRAIQPGLQRCLKTGGPSCTIVTTSYAILLSLAATRCRIRRETITITSSEGDTMPKERTNKKMVDKAVYIKTVDGSLIRGKINIGSEKRISDVFLKGEAPFIVVFDVGDPSLPKKVLVVNKEHIVWVEPDESGLG